MLRNFIGLLVIVIFSLGCASTQQSNVAGNDQQTNRSDASSEVNVKNATLELSDYLRRLPGVQITGSGSNVTVRVRTSTSVSNTVEPLYVIDGNRVGNSYQSAASQVDVNDIQSVRVLKDVSSTSMYGMQGANGVILIKTKTGN